MFLEIRSNFFSISFIQFIFFQISFSSLPQTPTCFCMYCAQRLCCILLQQIFVNVLYLSNLNPEYKMYVKNKKNLWECIFGFLKHQGDIFFHICPTLHLIRWAAPSILCKIFLDHVAVISSNPMQHLIKM